MSIRYCNKQWKGERKKMELTCPNKTSKNNERMARIIEVIEHFRDMKGALIPVLHEVQDTYGYLPKEILEYVSEQLDLPMSEIYGVATFYSFFSLVPKGEHVTKVCMGTACYIKGAQSILDKLSMELNVKVEGTTADNKYTLEATRCLGACGLAPVITIGEKVFGRLSSNEIPKILKEYNKHIETQKQEAIS
jgi:NADH:ubiquinone oxidoreductase subunit E